MAQILIVDDAMLSRLNIKKMLEKVGHGVTEAKNGREALEKVVVNKPDCILLDLVMPEVDGFEVLKSLRAQRSEVPVIVVSADIQESAQKQCMELGAKIFLNKPVKEQQLQESIAAVLNEQIKACDEFDSNTN